MGRKWTEAQKEEARQASLKLWQDPKYREERRLDAIKRWEDLEYRQSRLGENNSAWKGDQASYIAIHVWVRDHWGVPDRCEKCGTIGPVEAHNIPKTYKRDNRADWIFVCGPCHREVDPECRLGSRNWWRGVT